MTLAEDMANQTSPNHPFVVWGSCMLWLISMFSILWSLILFFSEVRTMSDKTSESLHPLFATYLFSGVGNILVITGTDIVNAIVLLSGLIMLPTNVYILCAVAHGKKVRPNSKVVCCPMWLCIMWIILINCLGVGCCIHKIYKCKNVTVEKMNKTIKHYRSVPKYKHFVDNVQWSLKCCGINSYQDWFDRDWYDKIRDYEWDPNAMRRGAHKRSDLAVTDSVPLRCYLVLISAHYLRKALYTPWPQLGIDGLSLGPHLHVRPSMPLLLAAAVICCKSGSCISNYLLELGTHSINTKGCGDLLARIIIASMIAHLIIFISVIVVESMILRLIMQSSRSPNTRKVPNMNVRHIMSVNNHFASSSNSMELNLDDTDYENDRDVQLTEGQSSLALKNRGTIDEEDSESA